MSLLPPTTCEESVLQYCNYGYDNTKYTSREDCLDRKTKEDCPPKYNPPATVSDNQSKPLFTETQKKWFAVIGLTALAYYILYKAGTFSK